MIGIVDNGAIDSVRVGAVKLCGTIDGVSVGAVNLGGMIERICLWPSYPSPVDKEVYHKRRHDCCW